MKPTSIIADAWFYFRLGVEARIHGLWHLVRGHKLHWRDDIELWYGITGDIWCDECPDTSDGKSSLSIWCRSSSLLWVFMQWACGLMGHRNAIHPKEYVGDGEELRECLELLWCDRCGKDVRGFPKFAQAANV